MIDSYRYWEAREDKFEWMKEQDKKRKEKERRDSEHRDQSKSN